MQINQKLQCTTFPCEDINQAGYKITQLNLELEKVKILMIIEAMPEDYRNYFYSKGNPEYMVTLLQAFNDAGVQVKNIEEIMDLGIYLTSAIKCAKIGYSISSSTIKNCSHILEKELTQFPDIQVLMLMGDVAIKAFNYISKRTIEKKTIPMGSTYKIRHESFFYNDVRVFPSYLPVGKNYLIEKSKRKMIAEDIRNAMNFIATKK